MTPKENRVYIFEQMPVRQAVIKQVMPAVASQMVALVYNLADTYFVGMLNDPRQTAAVTVVFPAFLMLTAISNLFGVGGASAIAQSLGKKKTEEAGQISSISFWFGLAGALAYMLIFLCFARPILSICGGEGEIYGVARNYARWVVLIGGPATILNVLLANLVRAEGGAASASVGVSLGGVLNIILDPLFILPQFMGLGVVGAGVATALSNMAAAIYFIAYIQLRRKTTVLSLAPGQLRYTSVHIRRILTIGFPSALQYALTVVAVAAQSEFVSHYATEAVAGLGIAKKLDQLPMNFSIGVASGLLPLLAYNHAAGNQQRRKDAFRFGVGIAVGFSLFCLALYECFAPFFVSLFIDEPLTIHYASGFLRRMVTAMPLMAICYPTIIQFQATGRARDSLICSVLRKGVLDIPLLFLMDRLFPLYGCMWVQPIVDIIALCVAVGLDRQARRREAWDSPTPRM